MRKVPILIPIVVLAILLLNACGSKSFLRQEPPAVESEIVKKTDWEVDWGTA